MIAQEYSYAQIFYTNAGINKLGVAVLFPVLAVMASSFCCLLVSWLLCSFGFVSLLLRCSQLYNSLGWAFTVLSLYIFLSIVFPLPYRFVATHFFLYPWARD